MRGRRWLLGAGEFLVGLAARRLPAAVRDERRREWEAELPVILGDPEIRSAVARAARMLSFAADTLRGSALGPSPGPARYRGAHRGATTWGKDDFRALGVGVAMLTMLAAVFAAQGLVVYWITFGVNQASYGTFYVSWVVTTVAILAIRLLLRRPDQVFGYWYGAGLMAAPTGHLVSVLAGRLGWGHPLLFTLVSDCGFAACAACISVAWVVMFRSPGSDRGGVPPDRRPRA